MSFQNNNAADAYQDFMLPTALDSDFSSEDLADDMDGLQLTMQRVKIPGGGNLQFEIRGDDPDNPDYERKLVGVILHHHFANAYWPDGSEYDDSVPPLCQSFDGKQGYGVPGGVCAACAFNQFGSTANGSGKACKNMRQIYLLRSGEYLPLQLSLPPTSLRPFNDFMNLAFVARRRPSYSAIVEIGLKRAESGGYTYSVATFRKVRDLEGEGLAGWMLRHNDALILESFGVGGIPSYDGNDFLSVLEEGIQGGKTVVLTTQVQNEGSNVGVYQVGHKIRECPQVLEAFDMTTEAITGKLMWILGQTKDPARIHRLFYTPVANDILNYRT